MSKTTEELEQEAHDWVVNNLSKSPPNIAAYLRNPPQYEPDPRKAYIAGYNAGNERKFQDVVKENYNERKLREVTAEVTKLKERIRTLCKANDQIRSIVIVVDEQRTSWQLSDNEFETHGKLGPYAGLFGRKDENT